MKQENFVVLLETLLEFRPFKPFTVELKAGTRFEVDHPHALAFREEGAAYYIKPEGVPVWFDHESVSSIERDIAGNKEST